MNQLNYSELTHIVVNELVELMQESKKMDNFLNSKQRNLVSLSLNI